MTVDEIIQGTADYYSLYVAPITKQDILLYKQAKTIRDARRAAMYAARELTELSYSELARAFNRLDHTTIIHNIHRASARKVQYQPLLQYLKGNS